MKPFSVVACLLLLCCPGFAQTEGKEKAGSVAATVAPAEDQEVVAEGRAAIGVGGLLGARRAAQAQALRNAVEKAIGVYVAARTLTQNYTLVRDQILTRSDGFATLKEVIRESVGTDEVRMTVRARVTLKPLAQQLKALKLTRAFRLYVQTKGFSGSATEESWMADLQNRLASAGFVVVEDKKNADLLIQVAPRFTTTKETPLDTAAGPMTMYAIEGQTTVQAVRVGTGEIVAAYTGADVANHINPATARTEIVTTALTAISPRLIDSLMVLPGALSQPVTLVVSNLRSAAQVGNLEDALERLSGVEKVTRRSFTRGVAQWELDVLSEVAPRLARDLEESLSVRSFHLTVSAETRAKITASVGGGSVRNAANEGR